MVLAYHVVLGAYGFWLPNDPRGSWSEAVWAEELRSFGRATKVDTRRSLAGERHDAARRQRAKQSLKRPAVEFTGLQARAVARGFGRAVDQLGLDVHACAILPNHVHLVVGRHQRKIEYLAGFLKRAATRQLSAEDLHPLKAYPRGNGRLPSPWATQGWYVYLNASAHVSNVIRYVEANPPEAGFRRQSWSFVVPFCRPGGLG